MEAETQHHRPLLPALRHQVDEHDLVDAFLSGKSPRTIQAYTRDLDDFRAFLGAQTTQEAAQHLLTHGPGSANATALSYRTHLQDRHLSSSTTNRRLAALRSLVKLARTFGIISWPQLDVPNVRSAPYRDTRGPGKTGVKNLITQLDTDHSPRGVRDKALLRLLYDLALRRGEVAGLDLSDVDLANRKITIIGKGYTDKQTLSLPEPTVEALQRWIEVRGTQPGPLFTNFDRAGKGSRLTGTSIYRIVREHGTKVGIKRLRPHGLRHTAITEAVKVAEANGYTLDEVRDFSRHRNVSTLMIYRDHDRDAQGQLSSLVAANF